VAAVHGTGHRAQASQKATARPAGGYWVTFGQERAGAAVLAVSVPSAGAAATAWWPQRTCGGGDGDGGRGAGAGRSGCGVGRPLEDGAGSRLPWWLLDRTGLVYREGAREGRLEWPGQERLDIATRSWRA
jgi:hypothetical protein